MPTKKPSYAALKLELDTLIDILQQDNIDVDEALKSYERGMELVKQLEEVLRDAENKVQKIKAQFDQ